MFGARDWTQSGANYLKRERRTINGTAPHEMESIKEAKAETTAIPTTKPAPASTPTRPRETLAGVCEVQKGAVHQLNLRRELTFAEPANLAMEA
jgi:hypothetical protein